jgi:hypothetical protein
MNGDLLAIVESVVVRCVCIRKFPRFAAGELEEVRCRDQAAASPFRPQGHRLRRDGGAAATLPRFLPRSLCYGSGGSVLDAVEPGHQHFGEVESAAAKTYPALRSAGATEEETWATVEELADFNTRFCIAGQSARPCRSGKAADRTAFKKLVDFPPGKIAPKYRNFPSF